MADAVHNPTPLPAEVALPTFRRLLRAVAGALVGTAAVLALLLLLANRADWWKGFLGASVASVLSAGASLAPLAWGLRRGLDRAVAGAFLAAGARAAVALGVGIFAVKALGYPAAPTLLLLVAFYFSLLAAETYVLARALSHVRA